MIVIALFIGALALLFLGFEMLLVLGLPGILTKEIFYSAVPEVLYGQKLVGGINHSTLMAIPFFILAAEIMARGHIARQLTNVVRAFLGHHSGGLGLSMVAASAAFGSVSGSAPATVAALGRILYPEMKAEGYSDKFSLGLLISSAEVALLIPPSITLIIYAWLTGTSVAALFAAGLVIGLFLSAAFAVYVLIYARRNGLTGTAPLPFIDRWRAVRKGLWALGLPVVLLGGIYSGIFTPTEAAAASVVYALLIELLVYRQLKLPDVSRIATSAAITTASIFVLLAVGSLVAYFITLAQVPSMVIGFMESIEANWIVFLLIVNLLFLVAGMFIDPNSTLLILVPALYPVAVSFGIDPIHFGIIVCLNTCIGMITPPFGLDIFVASSTLNESVAKIISGVGPFIVVNLLTLAVVTYVPNLSMFLPRLLAP
ncbi:C4-dicarboxylate ABC transporter permease [Devosia sp. Root436]|jgi:C4-dicarboxylate transporter DctM subunit|uniref:TRAP transporter large permease n=1 Tax=Devosia sp. Root436 TaxID=1736537 RepID=UPI000701F04F|nr:TRAP transporter large permease [Devosia sp. Root436]KQX40071.1 C4-dicarboxylate ABC transporter permease [Devosia sp. Root436]